MTALIKTFAEMKAAGRALAAELAGDPSISLVAALPSRESAGTISGWGIYSWSASVEEGPYYTLLLKYYQSLVAAVEKGGTPPWYDTRSGLAYFLLRMPGDPQKLVVGVEGGGSEEPPREQSVPVPQMDQYGHLLPPDRAMLWLRREPEGHFTLLLEAPGFARRALGLIADQDEGGAVEDVSALIEGAPRALAAAVLAAWKASKP